MRLYEAEVGIVEAQKKWDKEGQGKLITFLHNSLTYIHLRIFFNCRHKSTEGSQDLDEQETVDV